MASKLNPYPMPPDGDLPEVNINALRGHILGVTLDNSVTPGVDDWFITSGSAGGRNALTTNEKVITKLLNSLSTSGGTTSDAVDAFNDRFSSVVGNEGSTERIAFENIGSNLINAIVNLQDLSTDLVGLPEWNSTDYTLTFRTGAGDEVVVNLPLESLAMGLDYDHDTQEIILIKYDGSEIRVNIGDLVALYEGYESSTISTEILSENKIKATINLASIGAEHLKPEVLELLSGATVSTQPNNMLSQLPDGLYVPKVSEVAVSQEPDNLIEKKPDGLFVPEISADSDNYVGVVISDPASEPDKQIFPMGSVKPAAYLAGQFYAILFTNGHTASTLRLAFDTLPFRSAVYNNDYTIPNDLIQKGSMHLFAYTGSNFVYVGRHFEQLAEGIFTTNLLPNYKTYGELPIGSLIPVGVNERLMLNSMIIDDEGRLAKVKGIGSTSVTVYTIKDSDENETSVDHDSVRYNASRHLESVKFVDNTSNNAVGKITNEPVDLAQSELSIHSSTENQRIISIRKPDDSVSWQLRSNKGNITTLNIDENDDLLNRGQIINLMHETMGSALRTPEFIELESELPPVTLSTPDGTYFIVGDMDITAPGHEGRVWVNHAVSSTEYQKVVDKGVDADGDWIILNENNDFTFNTEKIIKDISTIVIQEDTGKPVSIDALLQVDGKASESFKGVIPDEDSFPSSPLEGYWVMIDNCNRTSPTNSGIAVFYHGLWIVWPFEAGIGNLDFIPEPADDGELYFRKKGPGQQSGEWIKYYDVNGTERTITMNIKHSEDDSSYIPKKGELVFLEDIINFVIGTGHSYINMLPLMYVPKLGDEIDERIELIINKGKAQGYAPLDMNTKIPTIYLPDTIVESITETEIDSKLLNLRNELQTNIIEEATDRQSANSELTSLISSHISNSYVHVTSIEKTTWDAKLDDSDLIPINSHLSNNDIHVTLDDKLNWDGRVRAYLVDSVQEMLELDQGNLKLGDICFVRISPGQYIEYMWYGEDGWHEHVNSSTMVNLDWSGINNKPTATPKDIDSAVTLKHEHKNLLSLNKINELNGQLTYNGIPVGATISFLATDTFLPSTGKEDLLYVVYRDSRFFNFPTISVWRNTQYEILGGGGGSAISPSGDAMLLQRELFGVVAGSDFIISVTENQQFAFYPIEVLRLIEGPKNQVRNYTNFTNPSIFNYHPDLIKIQNGMNVGPYEVHMNQDNSSGGRYYYSKTIDISNYHSVSEIY